MIAYGQLKTLGDGDGDDDERVCQGKPIPQQLPGGK